jgi:hypothetical protein
MGASTYELHKTIYDDATRLGTTHHAMPVEKQVTIRTFQNANLAFPPLCDTMYMCMSAARDLLRNHDKTMK